MQSERSTPRTKPAITTSREQEEETPSEPGDNVEVVLQLLEELPHFEEEGGIDHLTLCTE